VGAVDAAPTPVIEPNASIAITPSIARTFN
jgi:hypothetical protein